MDAQFESQILNGLYLLRLWWACNPWHNFYTVVNWFQLFSIEAIWWYLQLENQLKVPLNISYKKNKGLVRNRDLSKLKNCHFTTISSQFSVIYLDIFHKTEIQTVFLWLNWFEPQLVQILMHINLQLRLQRINVHQSLITFSMNFKASYFAKVLQKNYVIMAFYYITFLWPLAKICHITFHHHCVS